MKTTFRISKGIHIVTLLCFLLPFFNTSCEDESDKKEQPATVDSVSISSDPMQLINDSSLAAAPDTLESHDSPHNTKNSPLSGRISDRIPFLRPFLNPSDDVYSGLGTVLNSYEIVFFTMTNLAFLLLLLSLVAKFTDRGAWRIILLLELLSLIFLFFARYPSWNSEILWGYWTCLSIAGILFVFDLYQTVVPKRRN